MNFRCFLNTGVHGVILHISLSLTRVTLRAQKQTDILSAAVALNTMNAPYVREALSCKRIGNNGVPGRRIFIVE